MDTAIRLFNTCCIFRRLKEAKKLLNKYPTIVNSAEYDNAFIHACRNGHLDVAKLLYQSKPTIDLSAKNDSAFQYSCCYGQLAVAKWLVELRPWLYKIIEEDGEYSPYVFTPEEQRFYRRKYVVWLASQNSPNKDSILYKLPSELSREIAMML